MEIGELAIRDNKLDVGNDEVALSEVAEVGECARKLGDADPVSRGWLKLTRKLPISNYCYHICILLINTIF